jgi:DNA-binding NarL/FixJ family response regulator
LSTRIYNIEDDSLITLGLDQLLQKDHPDIVLSGYAKDLNVALPILKEDAPDVILLDLYVGNSDPLQNVRMLKEQVPSIPVVIISTETELVWKWRMVLEGVSGYYEKIFEYSALFTDLSRIATGEQVLPVQLDQFIRYFHLPKGVRTFSHSDLDLIEMRIAGRKMKEIAGKLGKSVHGVEKQCMKICLILNCGSMDDVTRYFSGLDRDLLKFGGDFPH